MFKITFVLNDDPIQRTIELKYLSDVKLFLHLLKGKGLSNSDLQVEQQIWKALGKDTIDKLSTGPLI